MACSASGIAKVKYGDPEAVAADLAAHGARPWQVELTALPISKALARLEEKGET